jgi:Flp pilus assembly protein TadG
LAVGFHAGDSGNGPACRVTPGIGAAGPDAGRLAMNVQAAPRPWRRLLAHRRGAAAVEMALIMMPLIMFIIGIAEVGYTFYVQQTLDYALYQAARQVATGQIGATVTSTSAFLSAALCPGVSGLLSCSNISVNVTPVSGFSAAVLAVPMKNGAFDPSGFVFCPGQPGDLLMAQAVYPAPSFLQQFLSSGLSIYQGRTVRLIASTAGFVNEPATAATAVPPGC